MVDDEGLATAETIAAGLTARQDPQQAQDITGRTQLGLGGSSPWSRTIKAGIDSQGVPLESTPEWSLQAPRPLALPEVAWWEHTLHPDEGGLTRGEVPAHNADLQIERVLGEGGMGRVELARQHSLQREVAVKRLKPGVFDPHAREMLLQEGVLTGMLEHPNIIPVHALLRDADGAPVIVMKRVEGVSLQELLHDPAHEAWAQAGRDRLKWSVEVLMAVCHAAHFAHTHGILHRDIKAENVMIGAFGEVYLLDWGIGVQLDAQGKAHAAKFAGTLQYMAPEMIDSHQPLTARTDVYLIGTILHEILTGEPRHRGESFVEVLQSARESAPYPYDAQAVSQELAALCHRAMHADPAARFDSAQALREALGAFLEHRAAVELVTSATSRVEALAALLDEAPEAGAVGAWAERAEQLATECRFALQQAVEIWPEHPHAEALAQRCWALMLEVELRRGNLPGAEAARRNLKAPDADALDRLDALARDEAARAQAQRHLQALSHDLDANVHASARSRVLIIVALVLSVPAAMLASGHMPSVITFDTLSAFVGALVFTVIISAAAFALRARIWSNTANRRMVLSGLALLAAVLFNRMQSTLRGDTLAHMIERDAMLLPGPLWIAAVVMDRRFTAPALITTAGTWLISVGGLDAQAVFAVSVVLSLMSMGVLWSDWGRERVDALLGRRGA